MAGFAEEVGLVGRDAIDQMRQLLLEMAAVENVAGIVVDISQIERPHALAQAPFDHRLLGGRQLDADPLLYDLGERLEVSFAEMIERVGNRNLRAHQAAARSDDGMSCDSSTSSSDAISRSRSKMMTKASPLRPMPAM